VQTGSLASECLPHERDGVRQLAEHEPRLEPEDSIARERKSSVPAPVCAASAGVMAAIDLDDEACRGGTEINDEGAEHDLAFARDAELTAVNSPPKALFGGRPSRAQGVSAGREQLSASDVERAFFQGSLLVPAKWPGVAPFGARSVSRALQTYRSGSVIRLADSSHQIAGLVDAVAAQEASTKDHGLPPLLHFVTTGGVTVGVDVIAEATRRHVMIVQHQIEEVYDTETNESKLRVGAGTVLNPEVLSGRGVTNSSRAPSGAKAPSSGPAPQIPREDD